MPTAPARCCGGRPFRRRRPTTRSRKARRAGSPSPSASTPTRSRARSGSGSTRPRRWPSTERPLCAGDILILVRSRSRARQPARRAALCARRAGRGDRPAASVEAAGGQGSARRDRLRGPAARRSQPRRAAGVADHRLDQEQLSRPRLRPPGLAVECAPGSAATSPRSTRLSPCSRRPARQRRLRHPGALPRKPPVGPADARRKLLERLGEAARDPIEELVASALEFEAQEGASLDRFLAWFCARRRRGQARPVERRQCGAGDDRPRRQGPRSPARHPRRRHPRSRQGRAARRLARPSARRAAPPGAAAPPAQRGTGRPLQAADRGAARVRPRGALALALCRADPRRRAADHHRGRAVARRGRRE